MEYNTLIAFDNYKLLSISLVDPRKKFKDKIEKLLYERIMSKMPLIKCRSNGSRRNSCMYSMF